MRGEFRVLHAGERMMWWRGKVHQVLYSCVVKCVLGKHFLLLLGVASGIRQASYTFMGNRQVSFVYPT